MDYEEFGAYSQLPGSQASGTSNVERSLVMKKCIRPRKIKQDFLTTGCSGMDRFLCGGIPTFGITEITGESGIGKSQFCLQLALTTQLPTSLGGLDSEVVFISTEKLFPSKRLAELTKHFTDIYGDLLPDVPMDKVKLEHISDTDSLLNCLEVKLPTVMREKVDRVRLVIVDSIAALFRADYTMSEMGKRTADLRRVGATLQDLSRDYNAAIFVVNQVTGSFAKTEQGGQSNIPSLGLAWTNVVTTRLVLSRTKEDRLLSVKFAPHIPSGSFPVVLSVEGFRAMIPSFVRTQDKKPELS